MKEMMSYHKGYLRIFLYLDIIFNNIHKLLHINHVFMFDRDNDCIMI